MPLAEACIWLAAASICLEAAFSLPRSTWAPPTLITPPTGAELRAMEPPIMPIPPIAAETAAMTTQITAATTMVTIV